MIVNITGASQRVNLTADNKWEACYVCHRCGEEFANSGYMCESEEVARNKSNIMFLPTRDTFCSHCGYKLTDQRGIPENDHIANLNNEIDRLESSVLQLIQKNKELSKEIKEMNDFIKRIGEEWDE